MINHYSIIDYSVVGIPYIEVLGEKYHFLDLYHLVGDKQYMATFDFKENSVSHDKYGASVVGTIYYELKTLQNIKKNKLQDVNLELVRINSPETTLSVEDRHQLKYQGVNISDISSLSYFPYKQPEDFHETGERVVPNVVEIKTDSRGIDVDVLAQNYLTSKNNSGVELVEFEKEKLLGIILAMNNRHIDLRILKHLGFDKKAASENRNVWRAFYRVKERRGQLTAAEKSNYDDIEAIRAMEIVSKIASEISRSGISKTDNEEGNSVFKEIMEMSLKFEPSILLHAEKQIYWDIESYLHITIRHLRDYQVGSFKLKTPFSYKPEDIKILLEKVIGTIKDEYKVHLSARSEKNFSRHGSMAILFNGDYYHLKIEPGGRLAQFHAVGQDGR